MGVVYRAVHRSTGEAVALKTLRAPTEQVLPAIRREIQALAALRHPNIVCVVGHGVHEGLPWCAMELVAGTELRAYCRRFWPPGAPPNATPPRWGARLRRVLSVVRRRCAPLAYLHGEGMVHHDLKPENVLVRPDGQPIIVDFGLASRFGGGAGGEDGWSREILEATTGGSGTIPYMAPELLRGDLVDARTDLYAVGCILYELLTARVPFADHPLREMVLAHLREPPRPPRELVAGLPPAVDDLIGRLLEKNPRNRLGYAEDLAAALAALGAANRRLAGEPAHRPYLYRARFVGRTAAMVVLDEALGGLGRQRGQVLLLRGESGAGKTRFALQAMTIARARGMRLLMGECAPAARGSELMQAFRGTLEAIADSCRAQGEATCDGVFGPRGRVLEAYLPGIRNLPGQDAYGEIPELAPALARHRLYAAFIETLACFLAGQPAVLLLDDLRWADGLSLGLLQYLIAQPDLASLPLLILGTFRSDDVGASLAALAADPEVTVIELTRLAEGEVSEIVGDMLALDEPPARLVATLHRQSEGNPFFVAEYLRAAVEAGTLWRNERGEWQTEGAGGDFLVPDSVHRLLRRRLADLPAPALLTAMAAAIIGREVSLEMLKEVTGLPEGELLDAWSELRRRDVLHEIAGVRLRFAHDKLRETAYAQLSAEERARLHRRAAEAYERRRDDTAKDTLWGELARHWESAGEERRAAACYLEAARQARARYGLDGAEASYRSYLRLHPTVDLERGEALIELGERVLYVQGRLKEAEAACLGNLANLLEDLQRDAEAERFYRRALAIQRDIGHRLFEGVTLLNLASLSLSQGRYEEASLLCEQSLPIFRSLGHRRFAAHALYCRARIAAAAGRQEAAAQELESALAMLREVGDRRVERAALHRRAGQIAEAAADVSAAEALAATAGHARDRVQMACERGFLELAQGRTAAEQLVAARAQVDRLGQGGVGRAGLLLARLQRAQGAFAAGQAGALIAGERPEDVA